jgi:hypothetical protein
MQTPLERGAANNWGRRRTSG